MSGTTRDYEKMFGDIQSNVSLMPRCACVACNSCTCACSCRIVPDFEEIGW
jgi:Cys-rich radical ribosomally synthesized peptide